MEEFAVEIETSDCRGQPRQGLGREALPARHQHSLYVLKTTRIIIIITSIFSYTPIIRFRITAVMYFY